MSQEQTSTSKNAALAGIEGEWIADILRVWDEENRAWNIHAPITIRMESADLIVGIDDDGQLGWAASAPQANDEASQHEARREAPLSLYAADEGKRFVTHEFIRFPALSEAVGSQVDKATANPEPSISGPSTPMAKRQSLELTLDTKAILKVSILDDGSLVARLAPQCTLPAPQDPPEAAFLTAGR